MRKKLFEIIEVADDNNKTSKIYDFVMMIIIFCSIIPLCFKTETQILQIIDNVSVSVFIIDYILRVFLADLKLRKGKLSFVLYIFTPMAIIDLLAILPSLTALSAGFRLFKLFRMFRTFRVFRIFKVIRYSKSIQLIIDVYKRQRNALTVVAGLAVGYIIVSALVVFNVEPDTFNNFFEAIYWATVSLTTVGYGDIYPVSVAGKIVAMISTIMGVAVVALPASIITAGYMEAVKENGLK